MSTLAQTPQAPQPPQAPTDSLTNAGEPKPEPQRHPKFNDDDDDEDERSATPVIDAPIEYKASDSIVLWGNGTAFLHGQGNVKYKTMAFLNELDGSLHTRLWS